MHQERRPPSVAVALMDKLSHDRFAQIESMLVSKFSHLANCFTSRLFALILRQREHGNGLFDKIIHRTDKATTDRFLNRALLFGRKLNGHTMPLRFIPPGQRFIGDNSGGASRPRTGDLIVANDALSQLSYSPTRERRSATSILPVACRFSPTFRRKSRTPPLESMISFQAA